MFEKYFRQTGKLFLHFLKRDWLKLAIWIVALTLFSGGFATAMNEVYGKDAAGLVGLYETMKNPAMIALCGPTFAKDASEYNLGAMYSQEMILCTAILFAIVAILHVIAHTRKEEDEGKQELLRSFQVGRVANSTAILLELFVTHLIMTVAIVGLIVIQDVPNMNDFHSSVIFALSLTSQGFLWGVVALLFSQIATNAGGAKMLTFLTYAVLYVARMSLDIQHPTSSWWNPISWCYLTAPFVKDRLLPIVLAILFSLFVLVVSYTLEMKRDMFGGFLPEREGKANASKGMRVYPGFVFRLLRNYLFWWCFSLFAVGAMYGSIFENMNEFLKGNAIMKEMFLHNGGFTLQEQFMSVLFMIIATITCIFVCATFLKLGNEEKRGRLEQVSALPIGRTKMFSTYFGFAALFGILGQFCGVLGLYIAQAAVMKEPIPLEEVTKAGMIWIPSILFFLGISMLLLGFLPRLTNCFWGYLVFCFFLAYFGQLMKLPKFVKEINIFEHIPKLPIEKMDWTSVTIVFALSIFLFIIGWIGYKSRDTIAD